MVAALLTTAVVGVAQVTTATVAGTVTDPSGAAIPGATVTITQEGTQAVTTKATNEAGDFQFDFVRTGTYTLAIEGEGFKRHQVNGLQLTSGQSIRNTYILEIGQVTETLVVEGVAVQLNTVSSEQAEALNGDSVQELPLARRNFAAVLGIGAGVNRSDGAVRLNGVGRYGTGYSVDGTDANANPEGRSSATFQVANYIDVLSVESVAEVNTVKGVLPAEYGAVLGGQINVMTKSGTNEFHGSVFENFQAENLNAADPWVGNGTKVPYTYNGFGGSAGGPIVRDKVFIFGAFEAYREARVQRIQSQVPTQFMRDQMLAAQPVYIEALRLVPLPNRPHNPTANAAQFEGIGSNKRQDNHADAKLDWRLNSNHNLAFSYSRGRPEYEDSTLTTVVDPSWTNFSETTSERFSVSYVTAGPTWASEARFGYNVNDVFNGNRAFVDIVDPRETVLFTRRHGRISTNLGFNTPGGQVIWLEGPTWTIGEKFSKQMGRHSIKFGGLYINHGGQRDNPETVVHTYAGLPDLLANIPSQINVSFGNGQYSATMWELGTFVQDDWRVAQNVTLNIGLRYDYNAHLVATPDEPGGPVLVNPDGLLDTNFNYGQIRPYDNPYESDGNNLGPRFGFAWDLGGRGKTVIRGGTGFLFSPLIIGGLYPSVGLKNAPKRVYFSRNDAVRYGLKFPMQNADYLDVALTQVETEGISNIFSIIHPQIQSPYTQSIMFGIQRQLTEGLVLETGYVGTRGTKFVMYRAANEVDRITGIRPNPNLRLNFYADNSQTMNYNAWQTSIRKRYNNGLSGSFHYTWSKAMSTNGAEIGAYFQGDNDSVYQDFWNTKAEWGPTPSDLRHNFAGEWMYELPTPARLSQGLAGQIFGGWTLAGIFSAQSGQPLHVTQSTSRYYQRPDYIGGEAIADDWEETGRYLNRSSFAQVPLSPASGAAIRPGTLARSVLRGPSQWNVDFSLGKTVLFGESMRMQIRGDFLNGLNHINPGNPVTAINNSNFGNIISVRGVRVIQLSGRFSW